LISGAILPAFRALALSGLLFLFAAAVQAAEIPHHKLDIRFDLGNAILYGTSEIEFPAGIGGIYHMPGLEITGIWIDGRQIDHTDRQQPFFADPDHELTIEPGETSTVKVEYTMDLKNSDSPVGDIVTAAGISLTNIWHPFLHQDQLFELTATVPDNFEAVSEAENISSTTGPAGKKFSFSFPYPLSGINFIAGPYLVEKTSFGDDLELYTYFFSEDRELAAEYRRKTLAYLARYEKMIGPFPYKRFSVIENRLPTGYSMPTYTVLGQSVVRLPFMADTSLGHETLHQWFGNSVRPDPAGGNWSEGLTTHLADALYQEDQGKGREFRKNQLIKYQSYVHNDNEITLLHFAGAQSHLLGGQEDLRAIGYTRSSMFFQMLRDRIGEDKFFEALRVLYRDMKHRKAGWQELITAFEQISGDDLKSFFEQWLTRPDLPSMTLANFKVDESGGRPVMSFTIRQANSGEPYRLSVPLSVVTDTATIFREIEISERETDVRIPVDTPPRELIIDDDYRLMRRLSPSELPPVWSAFTGADNKLAILDPGQEKDIFLPFLNILENMDCRIVSAADVTGKEIAAAAVIFLGTSSSASRNLFASPDHPATGMTVDIRANPLNPALPAVLVSTANIDEVSLAARKLRHYGKYSYLHFEQGRVMTKNISPTKDGQRFLIAPPPGGIEIGTNLSFDGIVEKLRDRRVVYIGESHTRYEDHLLQLRIVRAMFNQDPEMAIGMEMFNRSAQEILDRYVLEHELDEEEFLRQSHYIMKWGYDYRFYQPIINFAWINRIPIIALNLEKELVNKVYRQEGLDSLEEEEVETIPDDLDISIPGYRKRISSVFRLHKSPHSTPEKLNNFLQAQSLWDETMAESIALYLADNPGQRMAVIAGRGHVNKKTAIPPRVARRIPVNQAVVINVEQQEVKAESADYLVFSSPASLPPAAIMGVMLKEKDGRVIVEKLSPHGMAGKSGVKAGDIILALDGRPIPSIEELKIILFFKEKGDKVMARLKRVRRFWPDSELEIEVPL